MRVIDTEMGGLSVRVLDATDQGELRGALVMCHGFGAPGTDLVGVAPELLRRRPELAHHVRFVFPAAPLDLGPMYFGGRAWWHIDTERWAAATTEEDVRELTAAVPDGLADARKKLRALLDELCAGSGLTLGQLALGGFSQGSMLALDTTLRLDEPPALLCLYSCTVIAREEWQRRASARRGLEVIQSHGRQDPILPFFVAEQLRDLLSDAGLDVTFLPFDGPHTIGEAAVDRLADRLAERFGD